MRQAARKVALENSRLRSLLASRGVTDEEVNRYLASLDNQASGGAPATALGVRADATDLPPPVSDSDLLRPVRDGVPHNGTAACALETLAAAADIADVSVQQACCGTTTQCTPASGRDIHGHVAGPSPQGAPASPSPSSKSANPMASHLEMSCTAAAHIMANMHREGNEEFAREALGCSGPEECLVKNTLVFQLLDRADTGWQ